MPGRLLASLLSLGGASPCPDFPVPYAPSLDCGPHVRQCGLLAIDTGLGFYGGLNGSRCGNSSLPTGCTDAVNPPYHQPKAKVHGLWLSTPPFGNSDCLHSADWDTACQDQSWVFDPTEYCASHDCVAAAGHALPIPACYSVRVLPSCYEGYQGNFSPGERGELERRYMLWFVNHEWRKHGTCGGAMGHDLFFEQLCSLAAPLTHAVDGCRAVGLNDIGDIGKIACALHQHVAPVVRSHSPGAAGSNGEILLSACLNIKELRWYLAPVARFEELCGDPEYTRPATQAQAFVL